MRSVDVIVVGLGPGGEDAAGKLAEAGLDVIGIDAELVGGECPYWGCIPSKMMIRAANLLTEGRRIDGMAGHADVTPDFAPVARRIREATDSWDDAVAVKRLESKGATYVRGWAKVEGPGRVTVGDETFEARRAILLNPGARAWAPPIKGLAETPYWTNRAAIETETVPSSLIVIGGSGAIGLELGQVFLRFGATVTMIETAPRLLALEEPESSELVTTSLQAEGMTVHTGVAIASVNHSDSGFSVVVDGVGEVAAERLLVATGRRPDLGALGVGSIGLDEEARTIAVDDKMRAAPGVWAIGDVTGVGAFTHISMYQAAIAVDDIVGRPGDSADYRALPRVTFTDPEVGSVGLTEHTAREQGLAVAIGTSDVARSARGWIHKAGNAGLIKLVVDTTRGVLVGATSVGPVGGEVLSMLTLAVHAAVPVTTLRRMIYAYPTFHRAVEDALRSLDKNEA